MSDAGDASIIAESRDFAAAATLHALSFPDEPWSAEALADMATTPGTLLLAATNQAGRMSGFVMTRVVPDEAEVLTICVDPSMRGGGVGRALMAAARRAIVAQGAATCFLEVAEDNPAAMTLYARIGFVEIGRRRGYYRRGATKSDAVVMRLALLNV